MLRSDFRCMYRLRVRWAEVDMQNIVFNAHYLAYVDAAITEYWRVLALPYEASMRTLGGEMYVKKASLEYHASARMDDWLDIGLRCERVGNSSSVFVAGIFAGEKLLVSAEMLYVFADPATQTSRPVPPTLRAIFEGFEAGAEVTELRTGDWSTLGRDAARLRTEVFVREQGMAPELEADAHDVPAVHAVVYNRLGQAVATGRLLRKGQGVGRIERLAVAHGLRGSGVGRQLVDGLLGLARARGDHQMVLQAPASTQRFFERAGFRARAAASEGVGLPQVEMALSLLPEGLGR
jgi:YbgC/YbaW family acyl-CoA thioester hydrolase